ncbi:NAD(P)/FAD-dependent oxidoreductase [Nocardioides caldifontis]|uniref:NAD(P)/FAD-dependent oxidoreductase n=1 Tax=Nocardioides caldifontis TaxID=2588938 RepID=UPI0011DFD063|nr:FAD-dependent oxidoreductase [Nocardioides caldifontis]
MSSGAFVVVGAGLAGATAVATLREQGYDGRLVLVGAEPHLPYERPPLSKAYLAGQASFEDAFVHPAEFYDTRDVELRLGAPATGLDLEAHTVKVGGERFGYDRLLLATGSTARRLPSADRSGATVAYLRTVEDSDRIRAALRPGRRVVVVGGGWIGLEVAATARTAGCDVVVVEPLAEPLTRVLGPTVGRLFADLHRAHGVEVRTSTAVTGIRSRPPTGTPADGVPAVVELDDGTAVQADLLVVGIGAVPTTELAEAAGLEVGDGVLADETLRTSHPDVFVAGDLANAWHARFGRRLRVEHWHNAKAQGATAARNMLGAEEPHDHLPYFFTDQYDLGMEYVGHAGGDDGLVLRGDPGSGVYTAFWATGDRVSAAMHVNDWDATPSLRAIVGADHVDLARLRDPAVPLGEVVASPTVP